MRVLLSFDDATYQDLQIADIILEHGLEKNTVFYFPVMPHVTNEPKGRISLNNAEQSKIAENFEIGSHTISHRLLTRIPLDEARTEIIDSRKMLQGKFDQPINKFCYPRGYANPDLQICVQEAGYESARSTLVGYIHQSENPFFEQTTVHIGNDRKEYGGKSWLDYAKHMLTLARETPDSTFHIWSHGYELAAYPEGMKQFRELLKLITET